MDQPDADSTAPAVAGLYNLGNTCYLNAALQAMTSSRELTTCIATLAQVYEATSATAATQQQQPSLLQKFGASLKAAAKFVLQGEHTPCRHGSGCRGLCSDILEKACHAEAPETVAVTATASPSSFNTTEQPLLCCTQVPLTSQPPHMPS